MENKLLSKNLVCSHSLTDGSSTSSESISVSHFNTSQGLLCPGPSHLLTEEDDGEGCNSGREKGSGDDEDDDNDDGDDACNDGMGAKMTVMVIRMVVMIMMLVTMVMSMW